MNPALALLALAPALPATLTTAERPWTLLVYGAADNNADGPMLEFLDALREALDGDPGMELVLFVDRHAGYSDDAEILGEDFTGARLYRLGRDTAERLAGDEELPELGLEGDPELDSADPDVLRRFIAWGKRRFPAQRTGLLIYGHADGRTMCPDETSDRHMGIPSLTDALGPDESVDFLALELCNMGGVEIAYQWRPGPDRFGAEVLVAIPNAGPPLDWDRAFARIRSPSHAGPDDGVALDPAAMTALDLGCLVVDEGRRGRELAQERGMRVFREAAACYDLRAAADVKRAVDALARALFEHDARAFLHFRDPGAAHEAMNYTGGGPFVDLYDLCGRAAVDEHLPAPVRAAAEAVLPEVDRLVVASFGMSAYAGFEPGRHGVFITLPAREPGIWREFRWYTPLDLHGETGYGRWSFLGDGATPGNGEVEGWFELLDAWLDTDDEGGGINGYRP